MHVHDGLDKPAETAARQIENYLRKKSDVLFLTAGGSSLAVFDHLDPAFVRQTNMTVGVLDERLTTEDNDNNFTQFVRTRWGQAVRNVPSVHLINTAVSSQDTLTTVTSRLRDSIHKWSNDYPDGSVVALVGIGEDGHIAGMLPTQDPHVFADRFETDELVVGYTDDSINSKFTHRITTTLRFFQSWLDHAFVYAVGDNKCSAVTRLVQASGDVRTFPAWVLKDRSTELFTDCSIKHDS